MTNEQKEILSVIVREMFALPVFSMAPVTATFFRPQLPLRLRMNPCCTLTASLYKALEQRYVEMGAFCSSTSLELRNMNTVSFQRAQTQNKNREAALPSPLPTSWKEGRAPRHRHMISAPTTTVQLLLMK